jgi:hypothetical protein
VTLDNAKQHFKGQRNIGLRLGRSSHGLCDVDLDCEKAVALAASFLPRTGMVSGRAGNPPSHWFYLSNLYESQELAAIQFRDPDGSMICELRTGGGNSAALTVVPFSVHPSGKVIEWHEDRAPETVDGEELRNAVAK